LPWTKEAFRDAVSVSPGNYRVYVETSDVEGSRPFGNDQTVTDSFTNACVILAPDKKAYIYVFSDAKKTQAERFAKRCKKAPNVGVVEGPELT